MGRASGSEHALHQSCEMTNPFGPAEELTVKADSLEPVMQSQPIGEAYAAMDLRRRARDEAADFGKVSLGVGGRNGSVSEPCVQGVGRIPDQGPGRFELCGHLGAKVLHRLEGANWAGELLALMGVGHGLVQHGAGGAQGVGGEHHPSGVDETLDGLRVALQRLARGLLKRKGCQPPGPVNGLQGLVGLALACPLKEMKPPSRSARINRSAAAPSMTKRADPQSRPERPVSPA